MVCPLPALLWTRVWNQVKVMRSIEQMCDMAKQIDHFRDLRLICFVSFFHLKHISWYGSVGWQLMRQQYNHISPPPPHHPPMHHAMHHPCTSRLARRPNPNPTPPNRGTFELHDTAAGSSLILSSMANAHWPWGTPCCGRPWVWVNDKSSLQLKRKTINPYAYADA